LKKNLLILILFFTFFSCKKDKSVSEPIDLGYGYFPLKTGSWIVYDADSIIYDEFKKSVDTIRFELKELIESNFTDTAGRPSQRIEIYKRKNNSEKWILTDVWFATRTATRAEKVEENVRFVKLNFPVKGGKKWNGNAFNNMEDWQYEYTEIDKSEEINKLNFDSTLTVRQIDDVNFISQKTYKEKYAKNVGLLYRQAIDVALDPAKNRTSGFQYTQKIKEFGKK